MIIHDIMDTGDGNAEEGNAAAAGDRDAVHEHTGAAELRPAGAVLPHAAGRVLSIAAITLCPCRPSPFFDTGWASFPHSA